MRGDDVAIIFMVIIIGAAVIIPAVFYFITLQKTLEQVSPNNREVPPTNVWLMFIPLFNIVYGFILYPKICDSVRKEYEFRGLPSSGDFGKGLGTAMPILNICGIIPVLGGLAGIANFVIWIIFWSKMAGYKNELFRTPSEGNGIGSSPDLLDS